MAATWYLGPLGNLHPLPRPGQDINDTSVRYGGTHQAISGARTMDVTGWRRELEFSFTYLEPSEAAWLQALHTRMVPGPFYLLDPRYRNRASPQASTLTVSHSDRALGLRVDSSISYAAIADFPDAVEYGTRALNLFSFNQYAWNDRISVDPGPRTPVLQGETITGSWHIRTPSGEQPVRLELDFTDPAGVSVGSEQAETVAGGEWSRATVTAAAPDGAVAVILTLRLGAFRGALRIAAPQVEAEPAATPWEQGQGAVRVLCDQLSSASPLSPYRDVTMTLLEV